jgi:dTDP-4-dehydrorhamnose reductase
MAEANLPCQINGIPTADYPTAAKRPLNSRLDCSAFTAAFGVPRPDWRQDLKAIVKELTQ